MIEDSDIPCHLCLFPSEILLYIFTFLPAKQLTKCRQVCVRWKDIIDGLARSDSLWREYCKCDFKDIYKIARRKSRPGLFWYDIYRALSLWPQLIYAREVRDEFAPASSIHQEIRSFEILTDGVIGVHTKGSINYYDIETLERSKRGIINGDYSRYAENDDILLLMSYNLHLYVIRKVLYSPRYETNVTFDNVKTFILIEKNMYFVTLNDEIYICDLDDDDLNATFIKKSDDGIMSLGYMDNKLHILTFQRNIYVVNGHELIFECTLGPNSNLLHQLHKYNFLDQLDWRIYFQWMFVLNHSIPEGPLRDIVTIRAYGDVYFVGSNWGVLRIYYAPYSSGEFDLFNAEPIKQYNFMERYDCPVLSMCPILLIDILEAADGHTVLIAMPKKIAVLNFMHSFKRTALHALLPYSEVQKVKVLKLDECVGNFM